MSQPTQKKTNQSDEPQPNEQTKKQSEPDKPDSTSTEETNQQINNLTSMVGQIKLDPKPQVPANDPKDVQATDQLPAHSLSQQSQEQEKPEKLQNPTNLEKQNSQKVQGEERKEEKDSQKADDTKPSEEETKELSTVKEVPKYSPKGLPKQYSETKYFLDISRTNLPFGRNTLFPGSIQEIDISIGLKDNTIQESDSTSPLMLRVIARCNNQEFNDLDEYVFSVRSNQRFQYFEEVRFRIRKKEKAQVKVAVKIPPVKQNYVIEGAVQVMLEGLKPVLIPIVAKCELPQIVCIRDLYKPDEDTQIIKVPAKKNQIRLPPIPFKNLSAFAFTLEADVISQENFSNRPYDILTQNFVNCQPNTQFFINLQLKENMGYKGQMPSKDTIRKILTLRIKNSSVYFTYPLQIFIFESSNNVGGMS